jgi:hypothetical protein
MHDGFPFLFKSRNNTHPKKAFICFYPKGGSTQLKFLFRYAMSVNNRTLQSFLNESPHSQLYVGGGNNEFRAQLRSMTVPRFLIVRNPYIRFLSAYIEKIEHCKDHAFAPPGYKIGEPFEKFIVETIKHQNGFNRKRWADFNNHFTLMSNLCGMNASMTYDYYLPLEQMDYWYEPLIRYLGIESYTKVGWNTSSEEYEGDPHSPCFYHTKGKTCEEMFVMGNNNSIVISSSTHHDNNVNTLYTYNAMNIAKSHTKHITNSTSQLSKYYNDTHLLNELTEWMLPDLRQFNYPIWDGKNAKEYVKNLEQKSVRKVV